MWTMSLIQHTFHVGSENGDSLEYINTRVGDKNRKLFWVRCAYEKQLGLSVFWEKS